MNSDAGSRRRVRGWGVFAAAAVAAGVLLVRWLVPDPWLTIQDFAQGPDAGAPSCSWPVHLEKANPDQAGLIRCYLRAIAHHSTSELRTAVRARDDDGPTGFSAADFAHTQDVTSGTAKVTVVDNDVDSADATVAIRYADGVRQELDIHLANPSSTDSWRFWDVGTYPSDPNEQPGVSVSAP
ncbi:hypothetical protein ABZV34_02685 [Streptomyces sp. NPDC005195]|uniref:hypothetical protein n=1 Tax=Streptomyces sp. NPDC005195 TaxID=3154561 RepID=UPI0033AD6E68